MAAVYDDAARHVDSLPGDLPHKAAATHIGLFFAWAAARGLISEQHGRDHAQDLDKLTRRWFSGRDYVQQALGGRLAAEHLNEEGQSFVTTYYASGAYLRDYEQCLKAELPTLFHVRDDWTSYESLVPILDERLHAFRDARAVGGEVQSSETVSAGPAAEALDALPPPTPLGAGARPVVKPPPLPPRRSKAPPPLPPRPSSAARKRNKKTGGGGKFWILGIVLLFLGVRACGRLFDASQESFRQEGARHWAEEIIRRKQLQQQRAERIRQELEARANVDQIRKARWAPLSEEQQTEAQASGLAAKFENALGMRFVLIPSGGFVMGSPGSEEGRADDEELHNVEFSEPFHMLTTEVSISLWSRFDETSTVQPQERTRPGSRSRPIVNVSFEQATAFCRWLEERDPERTYSLPTEAEWEYACRAGTQERFWWGEDADLAVSFANVADSQARTRYERRARAESGGEVAVEWFGGDDGHAGVAVVGSYRASPWGLYDMLGNASEWCRDWYGPYDTSQFQDPKGPAFGTRRIRRGGSCESSVSRTRCASRKAVLPTASDGVTGFRVVSRHRR